MKQRYLRNMNTGVVFLWNPIIAEQPEMIDWSPGEPEEEAIVMPQEEESVVELTVQSSGEDQEFKPWTYRDNDGPVYRALVGLANKSMVTLETLESFNATPSSFGNKKFNYISIKAAVSEFKRRALEGE